MRSVDGHIDYQWKGLVKSFSLTYFCFFSAYIEKGALVFSYRWKKRVVRKSYRGILKAFRDFSFQDRLSAFWNSQQYYCLVRQPAAITACGTRQKFKF